MAELIIFSGKLKGRRLILPEQRDVVVGRDEDCQMRIASSLVSRKHCVLKGTPEGVLVRDLESQNGTYVNDVAVTELYLMKPGDVLRVGAALFQVPRPKPAAARNPVAPQEQLSDDEISSWLSDHEQTVSPAIPDTTVIKGRQAPQSTAALAAAPPAAQPRLIAPQPPAPPKSIKEQAAEIIKRHREMLREKEDMENGEKPDA